MKKAENGSAARRMPGQFMGSTLENKKATWLITRFDQHGVDLKLVFRSTLASTKLTDGEQDKSRAIRKLRGTNIKSGCINSRCINSRCILMHR